MALKAHIDPTTADGSMRQQPRRALKLQTSGVLPGGLEANVTIHNISVAGLLLETEIDLSEGELLNIELPEAGQVDAKVVWVSERLYGCAFEETLGQGALAAAQLRATAPNESAAAVTKRSGDAFGSPAAEPFGSKLNRIRRERGLTLADVADALGVSKPTVWAWEKGKARPLPERLDAIAAVLGVHADELGVAAKSGEALAVVEECRIRIGTACGTDPQSVRIMIEL